MRRHTLIRPLIAGDQGPIIVSETASHAMTMSDAEEPDPRHRAKMLKLGLRQCRYIVSDDLRSAVCCGAPTREGSSWCEWHRKRVFVPTYGKSQRGAQGAEAGPS
ncbi:GcrA family cell cycle regulator [Microvirga sp. TS319]|uniref:GcrA family cell cycle regulator n=1 Tax=Microvirga sp. TS319 TaxID=3241165 RepID=UPI00351A9D53